MADGGDRHEDHDPLLIAALLDDDPTGPERAVAEARIVACRECAALHADLLALSSATRALPTPPRPRDFKLTSADAARLTGTTPGEPAVPAARLTGVMTGTRDHAAHDTLLVAALADRSLDGPERAVAEGLVAACSLCARLHADLVAISVATRELPTPARTRDFVLTPADALRLRPSGWRRFIAAFGTSRDAFSRPLAAGLTAIGLAGLLFATLPSVVDQQTKILSTTGNAVGGPATVATQGRGLTDLPSSAGSSVNAGAAGPIAAASVAASIASLPDKAASIATTGPLVPAGASLAPVRQPVAGDSNRYGAALQSNGEDVYSGSGEGPEAAAGASGDASGQTNDLAGALEPAPDQASGGPSTMIIVSGVLVIVGLGLFCIRWAARRATD